MSRYQASEAGKGSNRREGKGFEDNYDKIFKGKPQRGRFIQDPKTHKMVPAEDYVSKDSSNIYAAIHGDIDSFRSPIDGSIIDDRRKLREHNKRHDVTNTREYGADWFTRRAAERSADNMASSKRNRMARRDEIARAMHNQEHNR